MTELTRRPIPDELATLLQQWIDTETWLASKELLVAHAERLLSDEATDALVGLLQETPQEDQQRIDILLQHQALLEKARAATIDDAYAKLLQPPPLLQALLALPDELEQAIQAMLTATNSSELADQVQNHPVLLTPDAMATIEDLINKLRAEEAENIANSLAERYATLQQMIAQMIQTQANELAKLLIEWISTDTWQQSKAMLQAHAQRLLSDEALEVLTALIEANENDSAKQILLEHHTLLETARSSIDDAYADRLRPSPQQTAANALLQANAPAEVQRVLNQYPLLQEAQTLQALTTLADRLEQEGQAEVARALHYRLDLIRHLQQQPTQTVTESRRGDEQWQDTQRIEVHAAYDSMAAYMKQGDIHQTKVHYELPPKEWQRPARQRSKKPFIGRQKELQLLKQHLLAGEDLTITSQTATALWGMAGIGKTFLARQLSRELDSSFPGGVIWVQMGPTIDTEVKASPILNKIAGHAYGGRQPFGPQDPELIRPLLEQLPAGRLLVVFDDVWHKAPFDYLDRAIPDDAVRLVTTRRTTIAQALGGHKYHLDRLSQEDGLALVISRFAGQETTPYLTALQELVSLLDGHALALDIAAGLIDKASRAPRIVEDLKNDIGRDTLEQLDLSEEFPEEDPRDTNLERSLSLSYISLLPEHQRCFRLLGVFAPNAPITPEAVAAVWEIEDLAKAKHLLVILERLALITEAEDNAALHYRQHHLLHAYAAALLKREQEDTSAFWIHASYYTQLVKGTKIPNYSLLLDPALLNILQAVEWTADHEPFLCSQLLESASQWLLVRGQSKLLEQYLTIAIAAAKAVGNRRQQANLLQSLGDLESRLGNIDLARAHYDAALPLFRAERARLGEANLLQSLGDLERRLGNIDLARAHYDAALPLFRAERARLGEANLLQSLGDLERRLGNIDLARAHYDAALPLFRVERARLGEASTYMGLADLYLAMQDWLQAKTWYEQALPLFIAVQDRLGQANTLIDLGRARFALDEYEQAMADEQQAVALFRALGETTWAERAESYLQAMQQALAQVQEQTKRSQLEASIQTVLTALSTFAQADWQTRRQLLTDHPELLQEEVIEPLFAQLSASAQAQQNNDALDYYEQLQALLRRCRTWPINALWYFAQYMRLGDNIAMPAAYEPAVMQIAILLAKPERDEETSLQAIQAMQTLLDSLPADVPALFRGALLRDLAERLLALPPHHALRNLTTIEHHYREALACYQHSERPVSVGYIQRALGELCLHQGRTEEALPLLSAALQVLRESSYEPHKQDAAWIASTYADALDRLGRLQEALSAYSEAITLQPALAALYRNRAVVFTRLRQLEAAESDLAQAVALDGHEQSPYLWYHRAQLALARGDGAQAERMLAEVLQRDETFDVTFVRAQSAWLLGDLAATQQALRQACQQTDMEARRAMQRDMERLFVEHPALAGRAELQEIFEGK